MHKKNCPKQRIKAKTVLLLTVTAILCVVLLYSGLTGTLFRQMLRKDGASFLFFSVGQASCSVIRTEMGTVMIDTGSSASAETLLAMLDHYGIRSIDLIVLTHADGDHSGGLDRLLETLPVSEVMMTERTYSTLAESYEGNALETATSEGSITLSVVSAGYVTTIGNVELKVLSPSAADESLFADENEASLVLLLRYGETEAIFPGDAGFEGEAHALDYLKRFLPDLSCEILLVGHHGSASSSSENFLSFLRPEYAVISCGKDNLYGHPTITVLDRLTAIGAEIYRTDTDGTVLLHSDGKNIVRLK